jgi:hypothetical protein
MKRPTSNPKQKINPKIMKLILNSLNQFTKLFSKNNKKDE